MRLKERYREVQRKPRDSNYMLPRKQQQQKQQMEQIQHDTWNIPELVQSKPIKSNRSYKREMDMHRQNSNYELAGAVMRHPYAYPEVFVSIFLGLDLDVNTLAQCATVCRAWKDFIHGYLWNSERVKNRVDHHWSTCYEPRLRDTALLRHNQDIRCFTGDALNYVCGLYNGNIEVWSANLSLSTSLEFNNKHPSRRLNRSDSNNGSGNSAGKLATLRGGHRGSVFCLAINGDAIVSGSFDHTICVWERQENGKFPLVQRLNKTDIQHTDMIYGVAINIFNQIVSSSHDSTVSVWQYYKPKGTVDHITDLNGHVSSVKAVDVDQNLAVTASRDRTLKVWSLVEFREIDSTLDNTAISGKNTSCPQMTVRLAGSPSCVSLLYPHVVVGLKSAFFQEEAIEQQEPDVIRYLVRLYDISPERNGVCLRVMHGHESRIMTVKMYPKSRRILSGDEGGHVLVWNATSDKKKKGKRHDWTVEHQECISVLSIGTKKRSTENASNPRQCLLKQEQTNVSSPHFDGNEMPSNAINTNNSEKASRIAGLVLSRRTGFVVAHQRGTLMDIEIT